MVVVTKEDKARADFRQVLADLREAFGDGLGRRWSCRSARRPRSPASPTCSARRGSRTSREGRHHTEPLPADVADEEHQLHDEMTEEIVATTTTSSSATCPARCRPSPSSRRRSPTRCAGEAFPVLVGVGRHRRRHRPAGRPALRARPAPADRTTPCGRRHRGRGRRRPGRPDAAVRVPDLADPFVGQVTVFRVLSGTVAQRRPPDQHRDPDRGAHPRAVPAARQGAPAGRRRSARATSARSPSSPARRRGPCWPANRPAGTSMTPGRRGTGRRVRCAWSRSRSPTTTGCRPPCPAGRRGPDARAWTASGRPDRPARARRHPPRRSRWSGWPACSAST